MTIGDRLRYLRKDLLRMSMAAFGAKIGYGISAISDIEHGRNALTNQMARAICTEYDVREEWLRDGDGEPFRQLSSDERLAEWMGEVMSEDESDIQRRVVKFLSKLTPAEWEMIADMAHNFVEELKKGEE